MRREFRIAAVSFLNTVPLIDWFTRDDGARVRLSTDLPSRLTGRLEDGEADAALVPVVDILDGRTGGILSPTGIACDGPVGSVALFCAGPLARIERVRTDRGSRSSVALARVLLREMCGIAPEFGEFRPDPGTWPEPGEALLVIGDLCFAQQAALAREASPGIVVHDLGALWKDLTGLPFVFAAWAASRGFAAGPRNEVDRLSALLTRARDEGLARLDELAAARADRGERGRNGEASTAAITHYFRRSLRFVLRERELAGVERFQELCVKHGLMEAGPLPERLFTQ